MPYGSSFGVMPLLMPGYAPPSPQRGGLLALEDLPTDDELWAAQEDESRPVAEMPAFEMPDFGGSSGLLMNPEDIPTDEEFLQSQSLLPLPKYTAAYPTGMGGNVMPSDLEAAQDLESRGYMPEQIKATFPAATTSGGVISDRNLDFIEQQQQSLRQWQKDNPGKDWARYFATRSLPGFSTGMQLGDTGLAYLATQKVDQEPLSEDEAAYLARFLNEQEDDEKRTGWKRAGDIVANVPALAGELMATGGVGTLARKGAHTAIRKLAGRLVSRRLAARQAARVLKAGAGLTARTAAIPQRVAKTAIERQMQHPDETWLESAAHGAFQNAVEIGTELYGGRAIKALVGKPIKGIASQLASKTPQLDPLREVLMRAWVRMKPGRSMQQAYEKVAKAGGWDGMLGELGEERVNEIILGTAGVLGADGGEYDYGATGKLATGQFGPAYDLLWPEMVAFAAPGGSVMAAGAGANYFGLGKSKQQKIDDYLAKPDSERLYRQAVAAGMPAMPSPLSPNRENRVKHAAAMQQAAAEAQTVQESQQPATDGEGVIGDVLSEEKGQRGEGGLPQVAPEPDATQTATGAEIGSAPVVSEPEMTEDEIVRRLMEEEAVAVDGGMGNSEVGMEDTSPPSALPVTPSSAQPAPASLPAGPSPESPQPETASPPMAADVGSAATPVSETQIEREAAPSLPAGDQGAAPASPQFVARGNDVYDQSGARVGAFQSPETAQFAAEKWSREGLPGEDRPTKRNVAKKRSAKKPKEDTIFRRILEMGGIRPWDKRTTKIVFADGGLLRLLNKNARFGYDQIVNSLIAEKLIPPVPENMTEEDHLLQILQSKVKPFTENYDKELAADYEQFQKGLDDAADSHSSAEIAEAVRDGEADGVSQADEAALRGDLGDAYEDGFQTEEDLSFDTSELEPFSLQREPAKSDKPPPKKTQPDLWFESPADALVPKQEQPLPGQKTLPEPAEPRSTSEVPNAEQRTPETKEVPDAGRRPASASDRPDRPADKASQGAAQQRDGESDADYDERNAEVERLNEAIRLADEMLLTQTRNGEPLSKAELRELRSAQTRATKERDALASAELPASPREKAKRVRPSVKQSVAVTDAHRVAAEDFKQRLSDPATVKEIQKSLKNEKWATKDEQFSNLVGVLFDPQRLAERPSASYDPSVGEFIPWAIAQAKLISQPSGTARKEAKARESLPEERGKYEAFRGPRSVEFDVSASPSGVNDPVSPGEIERRLSATFDVPVRTGKVPAGALGVYKPDVDVVRRVKQMYGQLGVTLHEVAHKIDHTHSGLFVGASPAALSELKKLDYDQTKQRVFEGFAEFLRMRMTYDATDPRSAERLAPEFTKHFDAFLKKTPALATRLEQAKRLVDRYRMMSPQQRFERQTRDDREPERPADETVIEAFRQKVNDAWTKAVIDWKNPGHLIQLFDRAIEQVGYKWGNGESKAHDIFDAMSNTGSQHAFRAIENGVHPIGARRSTKFGTGLWDAFEAAKLTKAEESEWTSYFIAQHVNELATLKPDYNPGMRSDDAQRILTDVSRDVAKQARYDKLGQAVRDFNDDLIRMLGDSGVLSQNEVDAILNAYEFYVPLERIADEMAFGRALRVFGLGGWLDVFKPVKARSFKGSGLPIVHPILSTTLRAMRFYDAAIKQQVKEQMARQIDPDIGGVKGMGWLMERVPGDPQVTKVQTEEAWRQIRRQLTAQGIDVSAVDSTQFPDMLNFWTVVTKADPANFVDRIMVDGQPVLYRMDPMLHYSLDQMSAPQLAAWQVLWRNFLTRPVKAGAVSLSTAFGGGNVLNDWVQYQFTAQSGRGAKTLTDPWKNLARYVASKALKQKNELTDLYDEWVGQINTRFGDGVRSPLDIKNKLMAAGRDAPFWDKLVHPVATGSKLLTKLEDAIAMTEVGPRMSEFLASLEKNGFELQNGRIVNKSTGKPERPPQSVLLEATKAATETMPFKRRGRKAVAVGTVIPFFEAWMTGIGKFLSTHRAAYRGEGNARQRVVTAHLLMAAATLAYWAMRSDDDDYREQAQWLDKYFTWNGVRLQRGREWGATSMLLEGLLNSLTAAESHGLKEELASSMSQFAPPMSPSGMPVAEAFFNYDLWRRKEIESQGVERLLPEDRVKPWTRPLARWIGSYTGKVGLGPLKVEFLLDRMTGGAANRLQDSAKDIATGDIKPSTVPFLGGVTLKHEYPRTPDELYERSKQESQVTASAKQNGTITQQQYSKSYRLNEGAELLTEIRKVASKETDEGKKHEIELASVGLARRFTGKPALASYPDPILGKAPETIKPIIEKWKHSLAMSAGNDTSAEDRTRATSGKHKGQLKSEYDGGDKNDMSITAARELLNQIAPTYAEQQKLLYEAWTAKEGKAPKSRENGKMTAFGRAMLRLPGKR